MTELLDKKAKKQAYMKAWREANKDKVKANFQKWNAENADHRKAYMKSYLAAYQSTTEAQFATWMRNLHRNYKMTPEMFNELWDSQSGKCAVCDVEMKPRGREKESVTVDHNHETGEVRGLLCLLCNKGLGNLKDSPEVLRKAAEYLEQRGNYNSLKGK